jgi:hypothetical protein
MNILEESSDHRSPVQYHKILTGLTNVIKNRSDQYFSFTQDKGWIFDIDAIAAYLAQRYPENELLFQPHLKSSYISIHFSDLVAKTEFTNDILKLLAALREGVLKGIGKQLHQPDISGAIHQLIPSIQGFIKTAPQQPTDLRYANLNSKYSLKKQRLHLRKTATDVDPRLKGHKLTIQVDRLKDFAVQITQGVLAYLQTQNDCTEDDLKGVQKELERRQKKETSDLNRLCDAMIEHSLARLQRAAQIRYLAFLSKGIQEWNASTSKEALPFLRILQHRLQQLEAYISNPKRENSFYQVSYQEARINLRALLSRADAFNPLPIITRVDGLLGETSELEKAQKIFTFGLKLKLNGPVQIHGGHGQPVFNYYTDLFNPTSALYQERERETSVDKRERQRFLEKMLSVALLYFFVFTQAENDAFDPSEEADHLLDILRGPDEEQKRAALQKLSEDMQVYQTTCVEPLRKMLVTFLHNPKIGLPRYEETLLLSLQQEILIKDLDSVLTHHHFFQEDWEGNEGKDLLKYVSVDDDSVGSDAICRLPVTMRFETIYYDIAAQPPETFLMSYAISNLGVLPIAFAPYNKNTPDPRLGTFLPERRITFVYRQHDFDFGPSSGKTFLYRFSYMLLSYLVLKLLLDEGISAARRRSIFLPIACLHTKAEPVDSTQIDTESFLHNYSKVLAHLLAQDYQASSQGFDLRTTVQGDQYKLLNALASLYNTLPRLFKPQGNASAASPLEKLAIITVSSRKADLNNQSPKAFSSVIYGDVIGMERQEDGAILARTLATFAEVSEAAPMHEHPEVIIAQVRSCYQQGYCHFLYVAQAPYTSTLHLPSSDARTELYFMNETVLRSMRQVGDDVKVYPIFYDKYSVVKQQGKGGGGQESESLYIDDLSELSNLASDRNKQTVIFLNVFNGQKVGKKDDIESRVYNGVVSYGTLVNMYEDTAYYQYIWQDLLGQRKPGTLTTSLLNWLTLLHFLRYEKNRPDRFKLDPYSRIIGSDSVGKCAILPHMTGRIRFNSLAFLSVVRAVLQTQ